MKVRFAFFSNFQQRRLFYLPQFRRFSKTFLLATNKNHSTQKRIHTHICAQFGEISVSQRLRLHKKVALQFLTFFLRQAEEAADAATAMAAAAAHSVDVVQAAPAQR